MEKTQPVGARWLALGLLLALAPPASRTEDEHPRKDDSCITQCDAQSDKCMTTAGSDKSKQKSCDAKYDECLKQCG